MTPQKVDSLILVVYGMTKAGTGRVVFDYWFFKTVTTWRFSYTKKNERQTGN
jgi:hypothetical protein